MTKNETSATSIRQIFCRTYASWSPTIRTSNLFRGNFKEQTKLSMVGKTTFEGDMIVAV